MVGCQWLKINVALPLSFLFSKPTFPVLDLALGCEAALTVVLYEAYHTLGENSSGTILVLFPPF